MAFLKTLLLTALLSSYSLASAIPHSPLLKRDGCQRGQRTINGTLFTVACGEDHPGGDYNAVQYPTFEGCIQACAADSQCVTAQYTEDTNFCYFKNTLNWGTLNSNIDTVARGDDCSWGNRPVGNRTCNTACGIDRPGGDYGRAQLNSFEACIETCAADSQCVSAQYDQSIGFCYYKNMITNAVQKSNVDTVICYAVSSSSSSSSSTTTTTSPTSSSVTTAPATTTIATTTTVQATTTTASTTTAAAPATCSPQPSFVAVSSSTCTWQISCNNFYLDSAIEAGNNYASYQACAASAQSQGFKYFTWVSYEKVPGYHSGCRIFTGNSPPSQSTYVPGAAYGALNPGC